MSGADPQAPCPCGTGEPFTACCGRYLAGVPAPTAEALMRSRYTGYAVGDEAYLLATWHPSTRPPGVPVEAGPEWCGLQVLTTAAGGAGDADGVVEFVARYRDGGQTGMLHETSRFVREEGHWLYVDGRIQPAAQVGRNDPCPCGSGRKFKRCCG